ncbi:MAG: hypothetical protein J3K34DRAFT_53841 [Monoraphidium minutum]|nr:MAG: hypothetical protein J3K34DRAFT_53841 [Monoraphidium minutum]
MVLTRLAAGRRHARAARMGRRGCSRQRRTRPGARRSGEAIWRGRGSPPAQIAPGEVVVGACMERSGSGGQHSRAGGRGHGRRSGASAGRRAAGALGTRGAVVVARVVSGFPGAAAVRRGAATRASVAGQRQGAVERGAGAPRARLRPHTRGLVLGPSRMPGNQGRAPRQIRAGHQGAAARQSAKKGAAARRGPAPRAPDCGRLRARPGAGLGGYHQPE